MGADNSAPYNIASWSIDVADKPNCFIPSPDRRFIAIGFGREQIMLYDWVNQKPAQVFEGCSWAILACRIIKPAWSPDSQFLAFRWKEGLRIMDVNSFNIVKEIDNDSKPVEFQFSPNCKFVSVGAWNDSVNIYDLAKDSSACLIGTIKARVVQHVQRDKSSSYKLTIPPQWSPDSQFIITRWNKDAQVHQVTEQGLTEQPPMSCKDHISDVSFSPDGTKVLVGYGRYNSDLWDFSTRQKNQTLQSCTRSLRNETTIHNTWSPNGELYAIRWDKEVLLKHTSDNSVYTTFKLPWYPLVMQWSPDGQHMALATKDDIWVVNVQSKQVLQRLQACGWTGWNTSNIEPQWMDNNTIIGRYDKVVRVWKL